jgi:hypothetical protein
MAAAADTFLLDGCGALTSQAPRDPKQMSGREAGIVLRVAPIVNTQIAAS